MIKKRRFLLLKKSKKENKQFDNKEKTTNKEKKLKKKKNRTSDNVSLPKTAQDTIPYKDVYKEGIIESKPNFFTKTYKLNDINFSIAPYEEQESMFQKYQEFLNSFDSNTDIQIVINNKNVDEETLLKEVLCSHKQDGLDHFRDEMNDMLKEKMTEGRNNLMSDKYLVVGTKADSIKDANSAFSRLDSEINQHIKAVIKSQSVETEALSTEKRLKSLHDILNVGNESSLPDDFDFNASLAQGLTTKDIISPSGFRFYPDYFRMGDKFARVLFIKNLPTFLSTDFLRDIGALPFNLTASVYLKPIDPDKAIKIIKNQVTNINANVIKAQKNAVKSGFSPELISSDLKFAQEQAEELMSDVRGRDQKTFYFTSTIMHYADSLEELNEDTDSLKSLGNRYLCTIDKLFFQQEYGFRNSLPLCINDLSIKRMLTTENAALFIPFSTQELMQKNGMYYGLNALSKNVLLFNRLNSKNQNGLILGQPGSGKSFSAKREMINVFLTTDDDIYVIDPENEYAPTVETLGGERIHLQAGSNIYINPFDMDIHYGESEDEASADPVTMKSDYICMLCETAMSGRYELNSAEKSIIDRCVRELYKPYLRHMQTVSSDITCDTSATPTMDDFYELLMSQPEPDAQNIALSLEIYCRGSFDTFAHHTNVDVNNRFVVYDIKDIGTGMKELGLQVCLNHIWNKIISNRSKGIRTWFYIDEFHVLTKTRSSAEFLQQIWKRARKWAGIPTAITQNVGDLLRNEASQAIINNCEFILMLSQSPIDRMSLAEMYKISETQLSYITDSPPGQGLIYNGSSIIPFVDKFPTNTQLYKIMSSKPNEKIA